MPIYLLHCGLSRKPDDTSKFGAFLGGGEIGYFITHYNIYVVAEMKLMGQFGSNLVIARNGLPAQAQGIKLRCIGGVQERSVSIPTERLKKTLPQRGESK